MNTNLVFSAGGYITGVETILQGFRDMLEDSWTYDASLALLVELLVFAVGIVGLWYGLRAILRAVRSVK